MLGKPPFQISLAAARVNAGFTQKQLAEKMKVSISTISNWEKAKSFPDIEEVIKLTEILDVPARYLRFTQPKKAAAG